MHIAYFTALGITLLAIVGFYVYMKNTNKKIICISYGLSSGEIEIYARASNNTKRIDSKITSDSYHSLAKEGNDLFSKEAFSLI